MQDPTPSGRAAPSPATDSPRRDSMHPAARPTPVTQLDALTGLRFVAAAAVLVSHVPQWFAVGEFHVGPLGSAAVGLFFVLSGFVLSHAYRGANTTTDPRRFYLARFARIWPLHAVCLALVFVAPGFQGPPQSAAEWGSVTMHALLLQAWSTDIRFAHAWNGPAWSLSVEAFFYVLFPMLAARSDRALFALLGLGFAGLLALYAFADADVLADPSRVDAWKTAFSTMPLARVPEFLAGMCAHAVWRRRSASRPPSTLVATVLELFVVTALLLLYRTWSPGQWGPAWADGASRQVSIESLSRGPGLCIAAATLISLLASGRGLLARALSIPFVVYLGEISYAFYLVHSMLLGLAAIPAREHPLAWLQYLLAGALMAIGSSAVLFASVETPMRRMLLAKGSCLAARSRVLVATFVEQVRRPAFVVAFGLGLVGVVIAAWMAPTPAAYVARVIAASTPTLRGVAVTESLTLRGAEAHVHNLRFACAAAIEGRVPEGAELRFAATTKSGQLVHELEGVLSVLSDEGRAPSLLLRASAPLQQLVGAEVLQLRLCRKGGTAAEVWPGSTPVEVYRVPG